MSDADLLIARQHANPHAYLGAHPENGSVVVRTFRPAASKVEVVTADGTHEALECVHPGGVFEGHLKGAELPLAYQLEVDYGDSGTITIDDPYRFLPTIGELDVHLLGEGRHEELWERLGAHVTEVDGVTGTAFAVWAPSARAVSVVGDFNYWDGRIHPMRTLGSSGIWELFLPGVGDGAHYKYEILAPGRRDPPEGRPGRVRRPSSRPRRRRSCTTRSTTGTTRSGSRSGASRARSTARCRSTRSTSAPGG